MSDQLMDVLFAAYQSIETAQQDFDGLVGLVKEKKVKIEGAILVSHDADGNVTIVMPRLFGYTEQAVAVKQRGEDEGSQRQRWDW